MTLLALFLKVVAAVMIGAATGIALLVGGAMVSGYLQSKFASGAVWLAVIVAYSVLMVSAAIVGTYSSFF